MSNFSSVIIKEKSFLKDNYMKRNREKIPNYIKDLGLPLSHERVYMLIDSFSAKGKTYFGSTKNTAKQIGMSDRSARRAIKGLLDMGLIEKVHAGERYGYVTLTKSEDERSDKASDDIVYRERETRPSPDKDNILSGMPEGEDAIAYLRMTNAKPDYKHKYISVGRRNYVYMTEAQFKNLSGLVSVDRLEYYVIVLEHIIDKAMKALAPCPKNHYSIIKRWIEHDTAV